MRHGALIAALTGIFLASATPAEESAPSAVFVRASISTAGPYGENWYVTLAPDGEAHLQVFYSSNPPGNILGRFMLGEQKIRAVVETLDSSAFFALPPEIAPPERAFHRPHLRLEVHVGGRRHAVSLYDPAAVGEQRAVDRFLSVWHPLFEALPFRPSW